MPRSQKNLLLKQSLRLLVLSLTLQLRSCWLLKRNLKLLERRSLLLLQMKKPLEQSCLLRSRSCLLLTQNLKLLVQNYLQ